ncbi:MAG: hypothetical protein SFU91_04915 [Chloroherpetonaceae bacterium]|nr:hypothetical protein [Chloroherpetonaceae bacterium]
MKKHNIYLLIPFLLLLTSTNPINGTNQEKKPKAIYKVGSSRISVWENAKDDGTTWKNFKVEKVYKKGDEWFTSSSFNEKELKELKEAIEEALEKEKK